jgi:non-specific serine/threonine protein kinase
LDLLSQLVEKSLVAYDEPDGRPSAAHALAHPAARRYRLLETVRQYSRDRLRESGQSETVRRRHRDWCLGLAERAEQELLGKHQAAWLARLEHDNLRVALEWGLEDEPASALRLATALGR